MHSLFDIRPAAAAPCCTNSNPRLHKVEGGVRLRGFARSRLGKFLRELGLTGCRKTFRGRLGLARLTGESVVGNVVRLTRGSVGLTAAPSAKAITCLRTGSRTPPPPPPPRARHMTTNVFMAVLGDLTLLGIASYMSAPLACLAPIKEGIVTPMRAI